MSTWWKRLFRRKSTPPETTQQSSEVKSDTLPVEVGGEPPKKERGLVRRITVGLDFGTSTTKCCLRVNEEGKDFHFLSFRNPKDGEPSVLMPTAARFCDGKVLFGANAEKSAGSDIVRSFKMCLLCQSQAEAGVTHSSDCQNCLREKRGWFRMGSEELSAEDLSTLFVAYVLGLAKRAAPYLLKGRRDNLRLFVNSAAPLDQMTEFGAIGRYFERVVYYGWILAGRIDDSIELGDAQELLTLARDRAIPTQEQSPTRIFPETHAAMTGYILLPQSESGLYGLVDVGAGTTDVAFFWLQKDEEHTKAWYYAAGSRRLGMDDVDRALSEVLLAEATNVREIRESLTPSQVERYRNLIEPVGQGIYAHQADVLDQAMAVDQRDKAWRYRGTARYRLFLAGGGNATATISDRLSASSHIAPTWEEEPEYLSVLASNKTIDADGHIGSLEAKPRNEALRLLLLSYGLAHRQVDIPKYERDAEGVKRESGPEPIVEAPSGHWW